MGMIQTNNSMSTPLATEAVSSPENRTCLVIRTGNPNCLAHFYPELYQLTLVKNGIEEKVDLGFSGSRLLERLARSPGDVVDRDELMRHAWAGRVVGQGSLNQQIYTLRQILADENAREIIQTLPRRGYFLNPNFVDLVVNNHSANESHAAATPNPATVIEAVAPAKQAAPTASIKPAATTSPLRKWFIPVLASCSAVLALGAIAYTQPAKTIPTAAVGKLLTITYAPRDPNELNQLISHGKKIEHKLMEKVQAPLHVIVSGLHENALDMVCLFADGSARTLHIAEDRLDQLSDSDWAPCLK